MAADGFADADEVSILGDPPPLLDQICTPDGRWVRTRQRALDVGDFKPLPGSVVVMDTGVCDEQPLLAGKVIEHVDVTGEGPEDRRGHGTVVAANLVAATPSAQIISVKALRGDGKADVETLCRGMREAARRVEGRGRIVNLSAGRRTPSCNGDCPLCSTLIELERDDKVLFICAAGNKPGITYCPGKSGFSVAVPEAYSADGDISSVPPGWVLR